MAVFACTFLVVGVVFLLVVAEKCVVSKYCVLSLLCKFSSIRSNCLLQNVFKNCGYRLIRTPFMLMFRSV